MILFSSCIHYNSMILPSQIVYFTFPFNFHPVNGEFVALDLYSLTSHSSSGSNKTTSAGFPSCNLPCSILYSFAGLIVIFSRSCIIERYPFSTSSVTPSASDVSIPVMPLGACSNGLSFSSLGCGAWSVAMISIVPSCNPLMIL